MFHTRPLAAIALVLTLPSLLAAAPLAEAPFAEDGPDLALAAEAHCPQAILDLTQEGPSQLGVTLFSPCHAGQSVVLDHAGLVLSLPVSEIGGAYASLPLLQPGQPVTVTFEGGLMTEALAPAAALEKLQQVSARW